jgi:hypothetical protein
MSYNFRVGSPTRRRRPKAARLPVVSRRRRFLCAATATGLCLTRLLRFAERGDGGEATKAGVVVELEADGVLPFQNEVLPASWDREGFHTGPEAARVAKLLVPLGLDRRLVHTTAEAVARASNHIDGGDRATERRGVGSCKLCLPDGVFGSIGAPQHCKSLEDFVGDVFWTTTLAGKLLDSWQG